MRRTAFNQLPVYAVLHQLKVSAGVSEDTRDGVAHGVRVLDLHDRDERDPRLLVREHKLWRVSLLGGGAGRAPRTRTRPSAPGIAENT